MKVNLETYINYLHSLYALLKGLDDHPLCQETIDSYYDLNPMDRLNESIEIFNHETQITFLKLNDAFMKFIDARSQKNFTNYKILEESNEWIELKANASICLVALDKYFKSMGVIPCAIFKKTV